MSYSVITNVKRILLAATLLPLINSGLVWANSAETLIGINDQRLRSAVQSQKRIDNLHDETDKVVSKYHQQFKVVEGLKIYNERMRRTLKAQEVAMQQLETSIENAAQIERQIVPLMLRMIAGLEQYVAADLPFKLDERQDRVDRIKSYLTNANISAAERFRKVLEAYSIENGYGKTIAVYKDTIDLEGQALDVDVLQLGRAALYALTTDAERSAYYDMDSKSWVALSNKHNQGIYGAIQVALKKVSPDLMLLPIPAPKEI